MKLINKILSIIILMLLVTGCNDFLEDEIQYTQEEVVIDSKVRSRGLIDDLYTDYHFRYSTDFTAEYLTDNGVSSTSETNFAAGNWSPTDNPYNYVWQQSYHNMRQIYQYIELVHDAGTPYLLDPNSADENETVIARYYGEAHFLKAWAEWELLKIYGGPSEDGGEMLGFPIVNGILENEEYASIERNTYQECVDQINADLDIAIDNLPLVYTGTGAANPGVSIDQTGRASGLAAYALKAKLALFAASPAFNLSNDNSKWVTAADACIEFVNQSGGLKSLQSFDYSNDSNPDHIWRMRKTFQNNELERNQYPPTMYGDGEVNPSQNLIDAFSDKDGYPIDHALSSYDENQPYASRDSRFYKFIFYNNDECFTSESCSEFEPLQIYDGGLDNYGGFVQSIGTRTGYYLKKFLNNLDFDPSSIDATTTLPRVYVQLGLTDMYLICAEALNEAYGQPNTNAGGASFSAKDVLEKIRTRAGFTAGTDLYLNEMSNNQSDFREILKNERRIELCFTGERFHDLRRWKDITNIEDVEGVKIINDGDDNFSYNKFQVEKREYIAKNYYLPLPYSELILNPNLKQNLGWEITE